ncbi:MAG: alpha/beta fold hydrolase [Gemmatimonadaceae bacterium]|nr:alpha/beta fold hydrolase [Gemmatimonadaceae bacterium]
MMIPARAVPHTVPTFFGSAERRLFGLYHAPSGDTVRAAGVVLCHPAPQEYSQTYWAFNKLAGMLASAGFHVLRFDYGGTGDSSGESADARLAQWVGDIGTAVQELRDLAGVRRISLVGMRVGAALAARATAAGVRVRDLVLWEPVVSGPAYLAELDAVEDRRLGLLNYPEPDTRLDDELMGYAFPHAMRRETAAIDLTTESVGRADRLLIVGALDVPSWATIAARSAAAGIAATVTRVPDPVLYAGVGHPSDTILPHEAPLAITAFLARANA